MNSSSLRLGLRTPLVGAFALCAVLSLTMLATPAAAQTGTLSLSPAVIMASGTFGQSLTQKLTVSNSTSDVFTFHMMAEDIVVQNGKRVFKPAGELPGSIAATALFSPAEIVAPPRSSKTVTVTITLPQKTDIRAIAAIFHAVNAIQPHKGSVGLVASIGTLITFNLSKDIAVSAEPVQVTPATPTTNLSFSQTLTNTGTEPAIPKGVAAILNQAGQLVGKSIFPQQRLLPGERLVFRSEYTDTLKPGHYRVLCTYTYAGQVLNSQADFTVQ